MRIFFTSLLFLFSISIFSQNIPIPNKLLHLLETYKTKYPIIKLSSSCKINNIDNKPFSISLLYQDNKNYYLDIYMDDSIEINYIDTNNLSHKLLFTNSFGKIYCQETIKSQAFEHYNLYLDGLEVYSNTISK